MNLNEAETRMFEFMKGKKEVSLDDLVNHMKTKKRMDKETLQNFRHSVTMRVKLLAGKLAPHGWVIERTSGIGRGNKATYCMEKR